MSYAETWDMGRAMQEFDRAGATREDRWVAANGGTETPFEMYGQTYLYVWNPRLGKHAYLHMESDMLLEHLPSEEPGLQEIADRWSSRKAWLSTW